MDLNRNNSRYYNCQPLSIRRFTRATGPLGGEKCQRPGRLSYSYLFSRRCCYLNVHVKTKSGDSPVEQKLSIEECLMVFEPICVVLHRASLFRCSCHAYSNGFQRVRIYRGRCLRNPSIVDTLSRSCRRIGLLKPETFQPPLRCLFEQNKPGHDNLPSYLD